MGTDTRFLNSLLVVHDCEAFRACQHKAFPAPLPVMALMIYHVHMGVWNPAVCLVAAKYMSMLTKYCLYCISQWLSDIPRR